MRRTFVLLTLLAAGCASSPTDGTEPIDGPPRQERAVDYTRTPEQEHRLMRFAMNAHLEHDHHDAAHIIEHALHARELQLSRREDEEALQIRGTSPKHEMVRRQLRRAAELYVDAGKEEIAGDIAALSESLWHDPLAGTREPRPRRDDAADREIQVVKERMEVMRWGVEIYVEKGRHDLAEKLELAIVARRMAIEGRRDAEANEVRERAPNRGMLAELMHGAGRLYDAKGWETRAARCFELSNVYREQWQRQKGREGAREPRHEPEAAAHVRELEERLHGFMVRTEELEERVRRFMERTESLEVKVRRFMERTERLEVQVRELTERLEKAETRDR